MQKSILGYLDSAAAHFPQKTAYQDERESITFAQIQDECKRVGSALCRVTPPGRPVVVFAEKGVHVASLYLGVAAAGCFYVPLDADLPVYRLKMILDTVAPDVILTDREAPFLQEVGFAGRVMTLSECLSQETDPIALAQREKDQLDTDPLYVIFTSGSSGVPKGVVTSHRNVIDYIDVFADTFGIGEADIFGNQAPLDYVAALRDLYLPLRTGAKTVLLSKTLFSQPGKLFETINRHHVTTLCWVASAFSLCAELGAFEQGTLPFVRRVFFTGSVLPGRHLRIWQEQLPDAVFVNHYGPTEITASCTYHVLDHTVTDGEAVPIGIPFRNTGILLLDETGQVVPEGEMGEICVRGAGLALGYYKNPGKTDEVFVSNPSQPYIPERIYRTGDLGKQRPDGVYTFHGRRDFQVKHMGHRIELPEIEAAALSLSGIDGVCCLYKPGKEQIWLFYAGQAQKRELAVFLRDRLPSFMVPRKIVKLEALPKTASGKPDYPTLKEMMG